MIRASLAVLFMLGYALANSHGGAQPVHDKTRKDAAQKAVTKKLGENAAGFCPLLDQIAKNAGIPPLFFARLIWQESRFNPDAISPKGAQGIAQFMPGTAELRNLADPFEPRSALVASAAYLADLREKFGNLGLAAAAYNAGEERVRQWLAGEIAALPAETRQFVAIITGRTAADWRKRGANPEGKDNSAEPGTPDKTACQRLVALLEGAPPLVTGDPEDKPEPPPPWGVQVAGHFSKQKTLAQFRRVQQRFSDIIGERNPIIRSQRNLSVGRRPVYQARLGAQSREEARNLCQKIKAAGGFCMVLRN